MALVGWIDTDDLSVMDEWRDAPSDPVVLGRYLGAAYEQCLDFLPHNADGQPVVQVPAPERYKLAQILQARALYNSVISGPGDRFGADGMTVTVFPMDWTVKNLLRPKRVGRVL